MTLIVHTARLSPALRGRSGVLDVTRKSGTPLGKVFAPSWKILTPALAARARATSLRKGNPSLAETIERESWEAYVPAYTREMRESYRKHRERWEELIARETACLCCYCSDENRCHRVLLAGMLVKLGATYEGEL